MQSTMMNKQVENLKGFSWNNNNYKNFYLLLLNKKYRLTDICQFKNKSKNAV